MSTWEPQIGASDEWYTPRFVFDALGERFDLDVAAPASGPRHVPADRWIDAATCGLVSPWAGFVWMNPPFGGRNGLRPWLDKFFQHGSGVALTPDRTSAPWWQEAAGRADAILFTLGKVQFERPDGTLGKQPGNGVTLWAAGPRAAAALRRADGVLGTAFQRFAQQAAA